MKLKPEQANLASGTVTTRSILAYVARHHLPPDALRADGRLTVLVDNHRIHIHPGLEGRLILEARILSLPLERGERERILDSALRLSCGRLRADLAGLAVDPAAESLWLQRALQIERSSMDLDLALAEFVTELESWLSVARTWS